MATSGIAQALLTAGKVIIPGNLTSVLTGTLTCVAGSKVVKGSGTAFIAELTEYKAGYPSSADVLKYSHIVTAGGEICEIDGVINDTQLRLKTPNVAGFSGEVAYKTAPALKDAQIAGNGVIIKMQNGSFTTPTSAGGPLSLQPNPAGVIPVMFLPTGTSITSSTPFEYLAL